MNFGDQPFDKQVEFFLQKLNIPTKKWDDMLGALHDKAFTVAGATSASLLEDLRLIVENDLKNGLTYKQFRDAFEDVVAKHGWTGWTGETTAVGRAWRSKIICETNLNTSYAAGRWSQIQQVKKDRPFIRYIHQVGEMYPRPVHVKWHNLILPADHVWWKTHYPPNGFGCKCKVVTLSEKDMVRQGLLQTPNERIPPGEPDKGWDYPPGQAWDASTANIDNDIADNMEDFVTKNKNTKIKLPKKKK